MAPHMLGGRVFEGKGLDWNYIGYYVIQADYTHLRYVEYLNQKTQEWIEITLCKPNN